MGRINWEVYQDRARDTGLRQLAFHYYEVVTPRKTFKVRSMLTEFELLMLYALAKDHYSGVGEIVDAGPLMGLSTLMLARGLAANGEVPNDVRRIYSFDLFLAVEMGQYVEDWGDPTGSVFMGYLELLRDYLELIHISPGDLLTMRWTGRPIEIAFIDAAKSWDLHNWMMCNWYPCLRPGSVVVHQDYGHFNEYWIAMEMEFLSEYFERVDQVFGGTVAFRCIRKAPDSVLAQDLSALPLARQLSLLERAAERSSASVAEVLKCGMAWCCLKNRERGKAAEVLASVRVGVTDADPLRDFSALVPSNVEAVQRAIRAAW